MARRLAAQLGIVGSINAFDSDPAARASASTYTKAAVTLYALDLVALKVIAIFNLTHRSRGIEGEKRQSLAALASIPFLTVRILYSVLSSFHKSNKVFKSTSHANESVVVQALMSSAMEFTVVSLYLVAGFAAKRIPRGVVEQGHRYEAGDARTALQAEKMVCDRAGPAIAMEEHHLVVIEVGQRP